MLAIVQNCPRLLAAIFAFCGVAANWGLQSRQSRTVGTDPSPTRNQQALRLLSHIGSAAVLPDLMDHRTEIPAWAPGAISLPWGLMRRRCERRPGGNAAHCRAGDRRHGMLDGADPRALYGLI